MAREKITFFVQWLDYKCEPLASELVSRDDITSAIKRIATRMTQGREPVEAYGFHVQKYDPQLHTVTLYGSLNQRARRSDY